MNSAPVLLHQQIQGQEWIKGYSKAMIQDQRCQWKSVELNDSHGLAWVSEFPSAYVYSVSWGSLRLLSLSCSREVLFSPSGESPFRRFRKWSPIMRASPVFWGYTTEVMAHTRNGPLKEEKLDSAQEEHFFPSVLTLNNWRDSDQRSGWLNGQEYHKDGEPAGLGSKEDEVAAPTAYPRRDSRTWKHSWRYHWELERIVKPLG